LWLAVVWIASALFLGATAGLPFAWLLTGVLPAMILGSTAGGFAAAQIARLRGRTGGAARSGWRVWLAIAVTGAAIGAGVAVLFGRIGSNTWLTPPGCFTLKGAAIDFFGSDLTASMALGGAATGALGSAACALFLHARARAFTGQPAAGRWLEVSGLACLLAAGLWSVANESLNVQTFGSRQPCNPDIGVVALGGYLLAAALFGLALHRRLTNPGGARAAAAVLGLAACVAASVGQARRSVAIAEHAARGGCGCNKEGSSATGE
jgi:hypothetical protein